MAETKIKINYWAVITTGLVAFFLSVIWYSPVLFGEIWERYRHAPNPEIPAWTMVFAPLRELIVAIALAILIVRLNLTNWKNTTKLMLLLWLAFHAVGMTGAILWDNMQWQLGAVHAGDWLMKMLFMGIVLTVWFSRKSSSTKTQ
jgi:hypothetical protein